MKKLKLFSLLLLMATSVLFVSCDGNDGGDTNNSSDLKKVVLNCLVEPSLDVEDFYDIVVNYGSDEGIYDTVSSTWSLSDFEYGESVDIPDSIFVKAIMTPKEELPTIDLEKKYNFTVNYSIRIQGYSYDDKMVIYENKAFTNPDIINMTGNKVQEFLDKGERVIVDYKFVIKK